jgi:hypothetical protein
MPRVQRDVSWGWEWFATGEPDYAITGKYLFFSSSRATLVRIACVELSLHGFHCAKISLDAARDYVLCLYYKDDKRKMELRDRYAQTDVKYRYWKSDADTLAGKYSREFLEQR